MKKGVKVLLVILLVLVLALGAVAVWQWDNIKAIKLYLSSSQEELEQLREENDQAMVQVMEEMEELQLQPLEEEDRERLRTGELTEEEAIQMVMGLLTEDAEPAQDQPPAEEPAETVPADAAPAEPEPGPAEVQTPVSAENPQTASAEETEPPAADNAQTPEPQQAAEEAADAPEEDPNLRRIAELIAKAYVMRDLYIGYLETIKNTALAEYRALPEEERTSGTKMHLASRCITEATDLEAQCDGEMDVLLAELSQLLDKVGKTQDLARQVRYVYAEEKAVKKAYYLSLYTN